ncbi:MAG: MFS transporter [Lachnospiraceae bacterium]|nr:MFS transporter [Lachnospiraceae bacterium]
MIHLLLIIIYLAFISLGLPDALLGAAWPQMYLDLNTSVSYAGIIFMIISAGTVVSSLLSDRLTYRFGTGKLTAISVGITAIALFGFSISDSFLMLCLWAIPYGLGAGCVDASLNNYVALHYAGSHMSWLHCMWGLGATIGPYIMGYVLSGGRHWSMGYRFIALFQLVLTFFLFLSLPLWKPRKAEGSTTAAKPLSLQKVLGIPGVKEVMVTFFCYCALEQTTGLWASSYLVLHKGIDADTAAFFASMFYIGITAGRAVNGFLTLKLNDTQLIRLGQSIILTGIIAMVLPFGNTIALVGFVLIGLGCAPIYPCVIHSTPSNFGADKSQAVIGVQMASAYIGNIVMPPLFGFIADYISITLLPWYLLIILFFMYVMHKKCCLNANKSPKSGC